MSVGEAIRQGFHYAITCRYLWLFGFFAGVASGGSSGGGAGGGAGGGQDVGGLSTAEFAPILVAIALAVAAFVFMRFLSEGALVEGVVRAREGQTMTVREGFRAGRAHWGVLFRVWLLYVAATVGSVILLAAPCVLAVQTLGPLAGVALAIPVVLIGLPWLITLHLVQAFASRAAVLENRHALDAIRKARLFLHGRLMHGLKLLLATWLGTLLIGLAGAIVVVPATLLLLALTRVLGILPTVVLGCLVLLPIVFILTAMLGTLRSSIWTIGYVTQVEF
ncbi:MAG TPA: hypothetical protein VIL35_02125 [Vicinamibacterales bacterium]